MTDCRPLIEAPRLIRKIRETGLVLFSYGSNNNDVANARLQKEYGLDAIIADHVALVRKGLIQKDDRIEDADPNGAPVVQLRGMSLTAAVPAL